MIIIYVIGAFIIFYASLVFFKLPISRAFFMVANAILITGFIMSTALNKFNDIEDIFLIPITTLYFGIMALFIVPWAYFLSVIITLKSKEYFNKRSYYLIFGAFVGIFFTFLILLYTNHISFNDPILFVGALVGFLTLLIDTKIYKFRAYQSSLA